MTNITRLRRGAWTTTLVVKFRSFPTQATPPRRTKRGGAQKPSLSWRF
jgi:hypothetical protein